MKKIIILLGLFIVLGISAPVFSQTYFKLPPLPAPEEYGNILICRLSSDSGMKSVTFSHWSHRTKYTCKVCHFELEFALMLNTTPITEEANQAGLYCGACHDGEQAFGHTEENCDKCHNDDIRYNVDKFQELSHLPKAEFGNEINWSKAIAEKVITPRKYFDFREDMEPLRFGEELTILAAWNFVPPAVFKHEVHEQWLHCSNCHPEIFNTKLKSTRGFDMINNLRGEFCGVCHGKVSFPLNNCKRCHPDMK
ncbi:MAG: hypothetical protein ISR96_11410 [Nitrospira sp.]|nr:hypothetical protein [bacterium]MBL7050112.1 hypothetical protein [Nitrospira sp.]